VAVIQKAVEVYGEEEVSAVLREAAFWPLPLTADFTWATIAMLPAPVVMTAIAEMVAENEIEQEVG
jgi:hypothetical protein